jgi:hypothetical protein
MLNRRREEREHGVPATATRVTRGSRASCACGNRKQRRERSRARNTTRLLTAATTGDMINVARVRPNDKANRRAAPTVTEEKMRTGPSG